MINLMTIQLKINWCGQMPRKIQLTKIATRRNRKLELSCNS